MRFRHYDGLRLCGVVARHGSFAAAADELNLTKGAVSYQIRTLEEALGFALFRRTARGVALTASGRELLQVSRRAFSDIERRIAELRDTGERTVTLGVSTYFASRWLSSRLMEFMQTHPSVRLRIQPMIDLVALDGQGVDLAIRWGDGSWNDLTIEPLLPCPAYPTGPVGSNDRVRELGLDAALRQSTLLQDRAGSRAWADWFAAAGIAYRPPRDALIIPDPNVRVQAVIDGQGLALNDDLVGSEIEAGRIERVGTASLEHYGYFLAYQPDARADRDIDSFASWLTEQSRQVLVR